MDRLGRALGWYLIAAFVSVLPVNAKPLLFIPGILGSELQDQAGVKVWGPIIGSLKNFSRLELPLDPAANKLKATGLVNSVQILGPIKIDQYSGLLETLHGFGFKDGVDLFVYPYDWRKSNFDTAKDLDAFVNSRPELSQGFNILAHSMGGLVARIYIAKYDQGKRVGKLVTMGTPHLGSFSALHPLLDGLGNSLENALAGGLDTVRRVAFSFPSLYEMLPYYNGCCYETPDSGSPTPIDFLAASTWENPSWLPSDQKTPARKAFRGASLQRARELRDLIRQPLPASTRLIPIAGAVLSTDTSLFVKPTTEEIKRWVAGSGDGTVAEASAMALMPDDARVAIYRHGTIFQDTHVKIQLQRLLRADQFVQPFSRAAVDASVMTKGGFTVGLRRVDLIPAKTLCKPGESVLFTLSLLSADNSLVPAALVKGWVVTPSNSHRTELPVTEVDGAYQVTVHATEEGVYHVVVTLEGVDGEFEEYLLVSN